MQRSSGKLFQFPFHRWEGELWPGRPCPAEHPAQGEGGEGGEGAVNSCFLMVAPVPQARLRMHKNALGGKNAGVTISPDRRNIFSLL